MAVERLERGDADAQVTQDHAVHGSPSTPWCGRSNSYVSNGSRRHSHPSRSSKVLTTIGDIFELLCGVSCRCAVRRGVLGLQTRASSMSSAPPTASSASRRSRSAADHDRGAPAPDDRAARLRRRRRRTGFVVASRRAPQTSGVVPQLQVNASVTVELGEGSSGQAVGRREKSATGSIGGRRGGQRVRKEHRRVFPSSCSRRSRPPLTGELL